MSFDLINLLETFDGKHVEPFQEAAAQLAPETATLERLCNEINGRSDAVEIGATWLLKHFLENGVSANEKVANQLIANLATVRNTDAQLHLLQSLPYLSIPPQAEELLYQTLQTHIKASHKFVRAWAYNGLGIIAKQNPHYQPAITALFDAAAKTESASVKVRIRKARKNW